MNFPIFDLHCDTLLKLFYKNLTFEKPDFETFDCLNIAFEAIENGGTAPTVMNAANEIAVEAFLQEKISFTQIATVTEKVLEGDWSQEPVTIDEVFLFDKQARQQAKDVVEACVLENNTQKTCSNGSREAF